MNRPEQKIHITVVDHLRSRGVPGLVFFHPANGGKRTPREAALFKAMGVRAGASDLILVHDSKIFALELKAENGRATEAQLAFLSEIDAAGAFTAMPTGLNAALATLESWGLLRGSARPLASENGVAG